MNNRERGLCVDWCVLFAGGEIDRAGCLDTEMKERKCKLWWSGKGDGVGGVGVMVKDELCLRVIEVRGLSDRVMTAVVVFNGMC